MDYELMKYRLTSDTLNIALWDMVVVAPDQSQPVYQVTWSDEFRRLLGFTDEREFTNSLRSWSDRLHPDDKERAQNAFHAHLNDFSGETPYDVECRLKVKSGRYRHFRAFGMAHRDSMGVPIRMAGALMDISDMKQMEISLEYRGRMLKSANDMAAILFSHRQDARRDASRAFDEAVMNSLRPVADAMSLDRIVIYRMMDVGTSKRFGQIYRWDKLRGGVVSFNNELKMMPSIPVINTWIMLLSTGLSVNIHSSIMSMQEMAFLRLFGVKSLLMTPVFINNVLWGGVAFQDTTNERLFDDDCISFLSAAARLCVSAIVREDRRKNEAKALEALRLRDKLQGAVNEMALILISVQDEAFDSMMRRGLSPVAGAMGINRIAVYHYTDQAAPMELAYCWRDTTINRENALPLLIGEAPMSSWLDILMKGECININGEKAEKDESAYLEGYGVKAVFLSPVFLFGAFWGVITFEDHRAFRYFEEGCLDALRKAAHLCVSAVIRNRT